MRIEDFIPEIVEKRSDRAYATMLVELKKCPICKKYMAYYSEKDYEHYIFPKYDIINFEAQFEKAGWVITGNVMVDGEYICRECESAGKADFLCALCNKRKPTSEIQYSIGCLPEFLCKQCYQTTPASIYNEKVDELEEAHRWDYE